MCEVSTRCSPRELSAPSPLSVRSTERVNAIKIVSATVISCCVLRDDVADRRRRRCRRRLTSCSRRRRRLCHSVARCFTVAMPAGCHDRGCNSLTLRWVADTARKYATSFYHLMLLSRVQQQEQEQLQVVAARQAAGCTKVVGNQPAMILQWITSISSLWKVY